MSDADDLIELVATTEQPDALADLRRHMVQDLTRAIVQRDKTIEQLRGRLTRRLSDDHPTDADRDPRPCS